MNTRNHWSTNKHLSVYVVLDVVSHLRKASTTIIMTLSKTGGAFPHTGGSAAPGKIGLYGKYPEQNNSTETGINAFAKKSVHFDRAPAIVARNDSRAAGEEGRGDTTINEPL